MWQLRYMVRMIAQRFGRFEDIEIMIWRLHGMAGHLFILCY